MVEKRKKLRALEAKKPKQKFHKKAANSVKLLEATLEKYVLDHNGKLIKKDPYSLRPDALPALFNRGARARVIKTNTKKDLSKVSLDLIC